MSSIALFLLLLACVGISLGQQFSLQLVRNATARNAVCNDGSPAGYYFRASTSKSSLWIVHLQGGYWCYDEPSCQARLSGSFNLTSSSQWSQTAWFTGLLNSTEQVNPVFYEANMAYVMYCSSDMWSGTRPPQASAPVMPQWSFQGIAIIEAVLQDLVAYQGMASAKEVLFSGCSAGGQGVVNNLDRIAGLLPAGVTHLAGLADAGWMLDINTQLPQISMQPQLQEGLQVWQGLPDESCMQANPGFEYMCYFSQVAVPHISVPILIHTEQYDTFQTSYDCCSPPFNATQLQWLQGTYAVAVRTSLQELRPPAASYSAACYHHCFTEETVWSQVSIGGVTLSGYASSWFAGTLKSSSSWNLADNCGTFNCSKGCPAAAY